MGEPAWRGRQLAEAIYRQRVAELRASPRCPKRCARLAARAGRSAGRALPRSFGPWMEPSATWSRARAGDGRDRGNRLDAGGRRRRSRRRQRADAPEPGRPSLYSETGRQTSLGPGHDLRLQPGRLRGQLPVLPDGQARPPAQPDRRRDRRPGGRGAWIARASRWAATA